MAYMTKSLTSIYGLRLGIQRMTPGVSGGTNSKEFLVGAEDIRREVTTAETTGTGLRAFGVSVVNGTSAASSAVYVLDPPIPGIRKVIHFGSTSQGPLYVRTKNAEVIRSSGTSTAATFTVVLSSAGGTIALEGLTTAIWAAVNAPSTLSGISFAATT